MSSPTNLPLKAQQKLSQLLTQIYTKLSRHPQVTDEQRELLPPQEQLMENLPQDSFYYQALLRTLAIDSYTTAIVRGAGLMDQLCGMLTAALQFWGELGDGLRKSAGKEAKEVNERYNRAGECLAETVRIVQEILPKNAYIEDQNKLLQSMPLQKNILESITQKLRRQNMQLLKKSQSNEAQILNMQSKLTKLLKQHEDCQLNPRPQAPRSQHPSRAQPKTLPTKISNIELREQLAHREAEIERMNQEFSFEIEKYNTVFQAMKRELEEMKGYQNIDLIQQIQLLETEIVRLREERERDQIIIRQLRSDNTVFSMGYHSPRESVRYQGSRFEY